MLMKPKLQPSSFLIQFVQSGLLEYRLLDLVLPIKLCVLITYEPCRLDVLLNLMDFFLHISEAFFVFLVALVYHLNH